MNVLLVEDEIDFQKVLAEYLQLSGYTVCTANHGKHALEVFHREHIDICVLDVMMPVMDGFTLAREIRKRYPEMPMIFLTARNQKEDKLKGLKLGADDYMTKPFEAEELVLRLQNILKRYVKQGAKNKTLGSIELLASELKLITPRGTYQLTVREAELLSVLIEHVNEVITREELLQKVWGKVDHFLGRSMDVFISRLRKYLKDQEAITIETIRTVGFVLKYQEGQ
jgi:DNA-binding response OmpR family regulator